jgi:hypothetical protein
VQKERSLLLRLHNWEDARRPRDAPEEELPIGITNEAISQRVAHDRSNWMTKRLNRYGPAVELSRPDNQVARQHPRCLVEVLGMHFDHDHIYLLAQGGDGTVSE